MGYLELSRKYCEKHMKDKRLSSSARLYVDFFRDSVKLDGEFTVSDLEIIAQSLKECVEEMKTVDD